MRLTFDPAQNARNIAERGLPFERVAELDWETAAAQEERPEGLRRDAYSGAGIPGRAAARRGDHDAWRRDAWDQLPHSQPEGGEMV